VYTSVFGGKLNACICKELNGIDRWSSWVGNGGD
jgi:hypothetical protein